jgi:hypothetical protein
MRRKGGERRWPWSAASPLRPHSITITTAFKEDGKEAGAVIGHSVEARVEVGGEERVYDANNVNPTITSLVEQLVSAVHRETLYESRPVMQRVLDAEKAFEQ